MVLLTVQKMVFTRVDPTTKFLPVIAEAVALDMIELADLVVS
jgi:hypothetical protein